MSEHDGSLTDREQRLLIKFWRNLNENNPQVAAEAVAELTDSMDHREDEAAPPVEPVRGLLPGERYYPELHEVYERVRRAWMWRSGVPYLKHPHVHCPACGSREFVYRNWRFHLRPKRGHRSQHRCDVYFKCTSCSMVWIHGVVVPPEEADKRPQATFDRAYGVKVYKGLE